MRTKILPVLLACALFACQSPVENGNAGDTAGTVVQKTDSVKPSGNNPAQLCGIDISSYQGDEVDFLSKNQDTLSFVICRATLGITFTDQDFANNWRIIQEKGFIRGAYHFYECDDDPKEQAQHYLDVVGVLAPGDLPPILDFEQAGLAGVTDKTKIQNDLLTFLATVEAATGRTPLIYVSPAFSNDYLTNPAFAKYPLYVADYDGKSEPVMPALWQSSQWTFWQKTDSVEVDGYQNDFDQFNGDAAALQSFIRSDSR